MKKYLMSRLCLLLLTFLLGGQVIAQDPFFIHFHNNASEFNPALVGFNRALSINLKYKTQWNATNIEAFKTRYISLEESVPCSFYDHGLSFRYDEEGPGAFRTYDLGYKFAGTIPLEFGKALHNFRFGASMQWSFKTINYDNFIFSDQLDPKYGTSDVNGAPLATVFDFPDENSSLTFFTPSVGLAHRVLFDRDNKQSPSILSGLSLHNSYSIGQDAFGNVESILRNNARIPKRWTAFVQAEFIPKYTRRYYLAIRPLLVYQRQSAMSYLEAGCKFSFSRFLTVGAFYHSNPRPEQGTNTKWFSFLLEFGDVVYNNQRIDLGFSFSSNFSGLKNQVGPVLEFSLAYHFDTSPTCKLSGKGQGRGPVDCVNFIAEDKAKIYDNIWYKTIQQK